jgi:putative protease
MIRSIRSFKIEGRLNRGYVAAVTSAYRKAIDAAICEQEFRTTAQDRYRLEMTFRAVSLAAGCTA